MEPLCGDRIFGFEFVPIDQNGSSACQIRVRFGIFRASPFFMDFQALKFYFPMNFGVFYSRFPPHSPLNASKIPFSLIIFALSFLAFIGGPKSPPPFSSDIFILLVHKFLINIFPFP